MEVVPPAASEVAPGHEPKKKADDEARRLLEEAVPPTTKPAALHGWPLASHYFGLFSSSMEVAGARSPDRGSSADYLHDSNPPKPGSLQEAAAAEQQAAATAFWVAVAYLGVGFVLCLWVLWGFFGIDAKWGDLASGSPTGSDVTGCASCIWCCACCGDLGYCLGHTEPCHTLAALLCLVLWPLMGLLALLLLCCGLKKGSEAAGTSSAARVEVFEAPASEETKSEGGGKHHHKTKKVEQESMKS